MMKRLRMLLCMGVAASLLSGCSAVDSYLENVFLEKSGIHADADYQEYSIMAENNQLNEEGVFTDTDIFDTPTLVETTQGAVHVTFADNRYLTVKYFLNPECTEQIDTRDCYLNPGDSIYASVESKNPNSNLYGISSYRISEYDGDNLKKNETSQEASSSLVYQIPAGFTGTEISIVPVGEYPDRQLSMKSYYIDDNGTARTLANAGTWLINEDTCSGNSATISPIVSYALKYDFDEKNYFFVSSSPKCFTNDPDVAGFVEFWEADPTEQDIEYSVELHPYLSLTVSVTADSTVKLNSGESITVKKNKTWSSNELKYGDTIVVETSGECKLAAGDFAHVKTEKDPITGGSRYTLQIVADTSGSSSSVIAIDEYVTVSLPSMAEHGTCTYKLDGKKVSGTITMQESQKLTITYTITDSEYKFSDSNVWNWAQDLVANMDKTATIEVSSEMNNSTVNPDEFFTIIKKGE